MLVIKVRIFEANGTEADIGYVDSTVDAIRLEQISRQGGWIYSNKIKVQLAPGEEFNPDLLMLYGRPPGQTVYESYLNLGLITNGALNQDTKNWTQIGANEYQSQIIIEEKFWNSWTANNPYYFRIEAYEHTEDFNPNWDVITQKTQPIHVETFPLKNIDDMRKRILSYQSETVPYNILYAGEGLKPYINLGNAQNVKGSQEGLGLKTYQSDLFNNWLKTEYIEAINSKSVS